MTTRQTSTPSQVRDSYGVVSTRQACVSLAPFSPHRQTLLSPCFSVIPVTRTYLRATCLPVECSVSSAKGLFIMPPALPRLRCSCLPCYSSLHWSVHPPLFMLGILAVCGGSECGPCMLGPVIILLCRPCPVDSVSAKNEDLEHSFSI